MVDYTSAIRARREGAVDKFLLNLGLDVETFDLSDTSESNMAILNNVIAKMYVAELYAKSCLASANGCTPASLTNMASTIKSTLTFPSNMAQLLGYTGDVNDPYAVREKGEETAKKAAVIDDTYETITGSEQTGVVADDVELYADIIVVHGMIPQFLKNIGQGIIDNDYVPEIANLEHLVDTVASLKEYKVNQTAYTEKSLTALNWKESEMPISATAEQVYNDVNTIATNLQNALTGGKFGDAFTSGMFANNKLSNLMLDAEKRLSQIATYQKAVFVLKNACSSEFGIAQTLTAPTAEQTALKEACADFNALTSKGDGMKDLCNKVYFTLTSASQAVRIVGQGSSSQISATISPAGLPSIIKQGCELLNGAWNICPDFLQQLLDFQQSLQHGIQISFLVLIHSSLMMFQTRISLGLHGLMLRNFIVQELHLIKKLRGKYGRCHFK